MSSNTAKKIILGSFSGQRPSLQEGYSHEMDNYHAMNIIKCLHLVNIQ